MTGSAYLEWAKARAGIRFNLAASGVGPCPLESLGAERADLDPGGSNLFGWPPLVRRIADRYGVERDAVVLAFGATMANHLACAALLGPGDDVLVERPTYEPLSALAEYLGARVLSFERPAAEGYRVDPERVREALTPRTRLVILTDLHNPSGARAGRDALEALARLADERDFHVLVDEVYLEWLHGSGARPAARISPRFVSTCSLTKAYGLDGLRVGWLLADPALAERIRRLQNLFFSTHALPSERLGARALERAELLLAPLAARVDRNRRLVEDFIAAHPRLSWVPPAAGTIGFVRLAGGGVDELADRLEREFDTALAPGRFFGDPTGFRLGFGMEPAVLEEGLNRLVLALG